ncbi:hypothetical protein X471_00001 [Bartonella bacilliformis str. Heidi Mejia]|uniref:DUF1561 family protein n=1 Tax=Bartonella bacilliformis TaxID=774 RepID=UPI000451B2CF|nr:DUF1561 family protein [Bartonella bacilliformis]EYS92513.1 hypothetical protein X471_00001 [Bartonella bacilliformis str. Heidi Mejia]
MQLKLLLFFLSLLLTLHTSFAAPIPPQIIQKPPQEPGDRAIRVKVHTGKEYCYTPTFVNGESYVYIGDCNYGKVARYDLFKRIAWKINGVWLCMTAPSSVTGIGEKSTAKWDYILLRPCVINDPNQQWIIKDNAFYTADKKFRVKDYKWYTYISKNPNDYYDHTLIPTMNQWEKIVATPVNINLKTFIGWNFASGPRFSRYYITDDGSKSNVFDLYYNPENGRIARYFPSTGAMSCMVSQQSSSENWDWVKWLLCNDKDTVTARQDIASWDISLFARREGTLTDYKGNFLRVTQYGSSWGSPYTAKPDYLEKDTTNSPKSNFIFSYDMERWYRYVNGNLGDTLAYCPAPGTKENVAKIRVKRSLPHDFHFTDQWKKRLWQIAVSSTPMGLETIGLCGPCMVQTMQILAELQERHQREPFQNGEGYFFNTQEGVDPFISLRTRFPDLTRRLETTRINHDRPYHVGEDFVTRMSRLARAMALMMLPQYEWRPLTLARTHEEMISRIRDILRAPAGTTWFSVAIRQDERGLFLGHVQPIIRTGNGIIILPTNTSGTTLEQFRGYFTPITDPQTVLFELSRGSSTRIQTRSIAFFQMTQLDEIPLSLYVSQSNCTGEGDGRRGNKKLPRSSFINQCLSGRCSIQ